MASSYCTTTFSPRAPSFIPRRASPFDASTSSVACQQDSDCGSSSGLGGMKTLELASDEGGSSSSGVQGTFSGGAPTSHSNHSHHSSHCMPRPTGLPFVLPANVNVATGLPPWAQTTPHGAGNDLFVHVQSGETLSVCIGGDMKNIQGPATVRMVGEMGISPQALPIQVPPGHMIHQILDEQGILRHLILSPENPSRTAYPPSSATPSSGCNRLVSSPPPPPTSVPYFNNFYTYSRPPHGKKYYSYHEESTEGEVDVEEMERVKDMLSRIQTPKIIHVESTSADIHWDEIDTSEASAPGGPFPQIDRSEFIYHIVLFEGTGKFIANYPCDLQAGNTMRLCELRPFTDYYVQLKASLEERGCLGEPSEPVVFKTLPYRPEPPLMLKVGGKGSDWVILNWRCSSDNGSALTHYTIYLERVGGNASEKVWEGKAIETKLSGLKPATSYHVRLTASNSCGESPETSISISTRADGPPPAPSAPQLVTVSSKGIKIIWNMIPDFTYTVEQHDMTNDIYSKPKEKVAIGNLFVPDLTPGNQYRFRIQAHNSEGDSPVSDWVMARMTGGQRNHNKETSTRLIVPTKPFIVQRQRKKIQIGWACPGSKEREFDFHVEGSTINQPNKYRTLYKGPLCTYLITEEEIRHVRVQSIRKGLYSEYSEVFTVLRDDDLEIVAPERPAPPTMDSRAKGTLSIQWKPAVVVVPPTAGVLYECKRIGNKADLIYCGPHPCCTIGNLVNREYVEVQVRAVIMTKTGMRFESEWSQVAGGTAPAEIPPAPVELEVGSDAVSWTNSGPSQPVKYKIYCMEGAEERIYEVNEPRFPLSKLGYAKSYSCRVSAVFDGGEGELTAPVKFTTPSGVPAQPENVSVEAESTTTLVLRWNSPDCRGDPISQYRIRVESGSEVVRESNVLISSQTSCEYRVNDLTPDRKYRLEISAQNSTGSGVSAAISGRTRALPPAAPRLEAEAESFSLKLKWKPEATHNFTSYRLVRLTDNDNHDVVYEGEQCFTKLKNLAENSEYRFQIRAVDKQTGSGPWSEVYCFTTMLAQPPTIRSAPTAVPSSTGSYQVEWTPAIGKPNSRQCFYRLQAIDCVAEDAKWHSVYEGMATAYTMRVSDYPGALQLRVACVRPRNEGREVVGSPSPVVYIANQLKKRKLSEVEPEVAPVAQKPKFGFLPFGRDNGITIISVMIFAVISCSLALFFEQFHVRTPDK